MRADWDALAQPAEANANGQMVGMRVAWPGARHPPRQTLEGRYCRVEPLDRARHGEQLFDELHKIPGGANWTYLSHGPFPCLEDWLQWVSANSLRDDPQFYAIVDQADGAAIGLCSYLRIAPEDGSIEVGFLNFSPRLQRSRQATEAMYLMMRRAFELGYRRYEWKCDAQNAPSVKAALRLGFTFEGLFRQARVNKAAIATRRGSLFWMASGRRGAPHWKPGWMRTISTRAAGSEAVCRRLLRRSRKSRGGLLA
ncbi:Acetyltransferase (GNAT) family [Chromobacterium violaceum]|uniref:Acetyltransferase (GNAT) family n=1 Tax=Chromobacterium violaceum TaxID=536 RepID=A0A447TKJ7_CHRVL|nr:Acetyltransferase (GNAT) family [Chromobacterium violaceum]